MPTMLQDDARKPKLTQKQKRARRNKSKTSPFRGEPRRIVERGSLYDVLLGNSGSPLFVRPICWTDTHARLLDTRWAELPRCDMPPVSCSDGSVTPSKLHMRPSAEATTLSRELTTIFADGPPLPFYSVFPIREVLSTLYPSRFGSSRGSAYHEFNLWFDGRAYRDAVRVQCLWFYPKPGIDDISFKTESTRAVDSFTESPPCEDDDASPWPALDGKPMLAYIGRKQLAHVRSNLYRVVLGPDRTPNEPVARLQSLRSKQLTPANLDQDPHFVGIIIAMAQAHFYPKPPTCRKAGPSPPLKPEDVPTFDDVTVYVLTNDNEAADFIVYKATVTAKFLQWFHYSTEAISALEAGGAAHLPGLDIQYTRVPTWPILGLKERLGKVLGKEVVGEFDENNLETYEEDEEEDGRASGTLKRTRNRTALTEVLNGSFDEECPEESPRGKRRRIGGTSGQVEVAT